MLLDTTFVMPSRVLMRGNVMGVQVKATLVPVNVLPGAGAVSTACVGVPDAVSSSRQNSRHH